MIRIVLITAAFFSVTIALLVIQPGPDPRELVVSDETFDVTRTNVGMGDLPVMGASQDSTTERDAAAAMGNASDGDALGFGFLDALSPEAAVGASETKHEDGIIASLGNAAATKSRNTRPKAEGDAPELELMVLRALNQGQSEDYIDALVNHAASAGTVEVPNSLVTVDGRVDTTALLSVLEAQIAGPGPGRNYEVEVGDTLASIAYRFYGTTSKKDEIFSANRNKLSSPSSLRVGLNLVLPAE